MITKSVGVFSLAFGAPGADETVAILNGGIGPYTFEHCAAVSNLGPPDLFGYGYGDNNLLQIIAPHRQKYDVCAILTSVPIQDNYFTRTKDGNVIISTTYQANDLLAQSNKTPEQYAALAVCQELVSFEFQRGTGKTWKDLFHSDPRGCLFDFAGIKAQKLGKLINCTICDNCRGKLSEIGIDQRVLSFASELLTRIRKPSFARALKLCITAPYLSFLYGGIVIGAAVNVLSALILVSTVTASQKVVALGLISAIVACPLFVYVALHVADLRRRLR